MKRGANFFSPGTQNACTQFYVPRSQTRMENLQGQEQKLPKYICLLIEIIFKIFFLRKI